MHVNALSQLAFRQCNSKKCYNGRYAVRIIKLFTHKNASWNLRWMPFSQTLSTSAYRQLCIGQLCPSIQESYPNMLSWQHDYIGMHVQAGSARMVSPSTGGWRDWPKQSAGKRNIWNCHAQGNHSQSSIMSKCTLCFQVPPAGSMSWEQLG